MISILKHLLYNPPLPIAAEGKNVAFKVLMWDRYGKIWRSPNTQVAWVNGYCAADQEPCPDGDSGIYCWRTYKDAKKYSGKPNCSIWLVEMIEPIAEFGNVFLAAAAYQIREM
jgi:hypothetical protein